MPIRFDILSHLNIAKFAGAAMPIVLSLWLGVFILLGIVLSYHWREYGYNIFAAWLFTVLYYVIGVGLIAGMFIAKITF